MYVHTVLIWKRSSIRCMCILFIYGGGCQLDVYENCPFVSTGKHLSNSYLSDLSIVSTRDIFVYR